MKPRRRNMPREDVIKWAHSQCVRDEETGCLIWQRAVTQDGYPQICFDGRSWRGHRLILGLTNPKEVACHRCDRPRCLEPSHLWAGSNDDNMRDMVKKGRQVRGERHYRAKLTEQAVVCIRFLVERGIAEKATIARVHGISWAQLENVINRVSWAHVGSERADELRPATDQDWAEWVTEEET